LGCPIAKAIFLGHGDTRLGQLARPRWLATLAAQNGGVSDHRGKAERVLEFAAAPQRLVAQFERLVGSPER
jgi:hypothetical protein